MYTWILRGSPKPRLSRLVCKAQSDMDEQMHVEERLRCLLRLRRYVPLGEQVIHTYWQVVELSASVTDRYCRSMKIRSHSEKLIMTL